METSKTSKTSKTSNNSTNDSSSKPNTKADNTSTSKTQELVIFQDYDSKQEYPAPDGKRLITCLYRENKNGERVMPNQYCFAPDWITEEIIKENIDTLAEYFVSYLQGLEEEKVKDNHKKGTTKLGLSFFKFDNLLTYLEEKGTSSKLSAKAIGQWYIDSGFSTVIFEYYNTKAGEAKASKIADYVGTKLTELSSHKTLWNEPEQIKFIDILEPVKDEVIGKRLLARVVAMKTKGVEDLFDML